VKVLHGAKVGDTMGKSVCRFVFRRSRRRPRTRGRADDGWKRRERRGDDDGDCEIDGARRARRVGFVDAKEEAEDLTFFGLQSRATRDDGCLYAVGVGVEGGGASMRSMRFVREDDFASRSAETVPEAYSSLAARRFISSRS